jgi:hypothetical protein
VSDRLSPLMRHLSDRYEVSITAAILKWLGINYKRAIIVVSKDGFIDWAWGSKRLFKSGIYYRARQETVPLPAGRTQSRIFSR